MKKGEITVFLSLVFILLISFVGALLESASIQAAKDYRRMDMERAAESVFAEYQKALLEEYDIFALDSSYESSEYSLTKITDRLKFYGAGSGEQEIKRVCLLTDYGGQAFCEQAETYTAAKWGLDKLQKQMEDTGKWEEQEQQSEVYREEEEEVGREIEAQLAETQEQLPTENNPMASMSNLRQSGFLNVVLPDQAEVSAKTVDLMQLPSHRNLQKGYGSFAGGGGETISKLSLQEYLMEHFRNFLQPSEDHGLSYEIEYLIGGKESDRENLEAVVTQLAALRFVPNYAFLQKDAAKQAEAEAMALSLCTLLTVPAVSEVVKQGILLAWALGESLMDVRALLADHKVPTVKTAESWQLSLSGLLKLGTGQEHNETRDAENGLGYPDYLRMLLFLQGKEKLTMRALDMIEKTIQTAKGLPHFQVDHCISKIEIHSLYKFRRGISYDFNTYYEYQ